MPNKGLQLRGLIALTGAFGLSTTLAVDPDTHRVYTPEQEADGKAVARMVVCEALVSP